MHPSSSSSRPRRLTRFQCDAVRPTCGACVKRKIDCVYAHIDTVQGLKRKYEDVEGDLEAYAELYRFVQTRTVEDGAQVMRLIRSGDDVLSVLHQVKYGNLLLQLAVRPETSFRYTVPLGAEMPDRLMAPSNSALASLIYLNRDDAAPTGTTEIVSPKGPPQWAAFEAQYRIPLHAAELVEPRIEEASIASWTLVAVDETILKDLLRVYFQYGYAFFPFFHKDLFLDDLVAGRRRHCSSLLVNAILTNACHAYRRSADRSEFWNPTTLQYRFSAETRRLRELEVDRPRLTTVQATLLLSLDHNMNGTDRIGWALMLQAVAMAHSMKLFDRLPASIDGMRRIARVHTAWQVYCWQA